jgi:hypothetical protein
LLVPSATLTLLMILSSRARAPLRLKQAPPMGAGDDVARQAAASVLTSKTGVDLSNQSADAALFGRLTQIGGADAARHATDGARFVTTFSSMSSTTALSRPCTRRESACWWRQGKRAPLRVQGRGDRIARHRGATLRR